ncbi:hypothetical protein QZH41_013542 [Actinostola sp. cb2023]|nr:hypothetical protein QZH41_013542 [Actinostola sp. cb2023]
MGCGSSREVAPQQNNNIPNGNVKSEPEPGPPNNNHVDASPKNIDDEKPAKKKRDSSSSSSSSSSNSSIQSKHDKDKDKQDQVDGKPVSAPQESEAAEASDTKPDNENANETDVQEKPNFTEEVLKSFVELETEIKDLENKYQDIIHAEYKRLLELHKALESQGGKVEELKRQTIKEYQDIIQVTQPSVRAMFINANQHDAQVAKEQQEYLDALNKQEVAQQELDSMKEQYKHLYNAYNSHATSIKADRKKLQDLKYKQEQLLGKIFNDSYGSDKEWKLEMEFDLIVEKKERVKSAHYKWSSARSFIATAASQINWAAKRWGQILSHNVQGQLVKYQMTAETRNHLVAAIQNLRSTHKFLEPIKVPYYSQDDILELDRALNTIFHDVQVPARYRQAHASFTEHFNKARNLLNWIEQVLKSTITPDLEKVKKNYHVKYFELKEERMTLIQNIIKEKLGVEMTMELKKEEYKETEESAVSDQQVIQPGQVVKEEGEEQAPEPEAQNEEPPAEIPEAAPATEASEEDKPDTSAAEGESEAQPADAKPRVKAVPLSELAPAPNQEDLFGNIDQLKKKHEEEIAEFEKAQELNKARVDQGLQERLQTRRNRKRKMQQQQEETAALSGDNDDSLPPPIE